MPSASTCTRLVRRLAAVAAVVSSVASAPAEAAQPAPPAEAPAFRPTASMDLAALERLVRGRSAACEEAALNVDVARAESRQTHLLDNPTLDASWATIPVGRTNPPDLPEPMANVPNYGAGLAYTFQLGKRGPRQRRADFLERGARANLEATVRAQALELARLLGYSATVTLRMEGLRGLVDEAKRSVALAESRQNASFGTPLDVDRVRIEYSRAEQQLRSAQSDLAGMMAECSAMVGAACEPFADTAAAQGWLTHWINQTPTLADIERRADLRALQAYRLAAEQEADLAHAQSIPDPTVRVGYVHDRFIASGAQQNSLNLSVSVPLPVFDHGQAAAAAAESRAGHLAEERRRMIAAAQSRIPQLIDRVRAQQERQRILSTDIIPRARRVLDDVETAAGSRLLTVSDVIQARRTVSELLVEEADSYGDAFEAAIELAAQLPSAAPDAGPATPGPTQEPSR